MELKIIFYTFSVFEKTAGCGEKYLRIIEKVCLLDNYEFYMEQSILKLIFL